MKAKMTILSAIVVMVLITPVYAMEDFNVNDKINMMRTDLNLTDDQANAVKPILADYKNKLEQAHKEKEDRLKNILSSDQMSKMKDMKKERNKMENKMEKME